MRDNLVALIEGARKTAGASTEEELVEAWSDLDRLGHRTMWMAVAVQLIKIQLERPVVLPLAVLMCGFSVYYTVARWVS